MKVLFEKLKEVLVGGQDAVLVTVVASSGSTPRGSGARMLVTHKGRVCGTIGGGAVEYRSEQMAAQVLKDKCSLVENFQLNARDVADLGMICGGAVDVYFRYISAADEEVLALTERILNLFSTGEQCWLICELTAGSEGAMSVCGKHTGIFGRKVPEKLLNSLEQKPEMRQLEDKLYYVEQLQRPGKVYIFGGGHVAQELVPVLAGVGFRCVVIEDRPDFAAEELFPGVERTCLIEPSQLPEIAAMIGEDDYVCVMTRGHKDDLEVQRWVLGTKARYIGVIGSPAKKKGVFEKLRAFGYGDSDFERITAPIGLDIGGETPAEIAVSIAAQLIMVRAGRQAGSWEV